jgi:hypothetical protein
MAYRAMKPRLCSWARGTNSSTGSLVTKLIWLLDFAALSACGIIFLAIK